MVATSLKGISRLIIETISPSEIVSGARSWTCGVDGYGLVKCLLSHWSDMGSREPVKQIWRKGFYAMRSPRRGMPVRPNARFCSRNSQGNAKWRVTKLL